MVAGNVIRSAENALKSEERRLQIYKEVTAATQMGSKTVGTERSSGVLNS